MRYLYFLLILTLVGCGSSAEEAEATVEDATDALEDEIKRISKEDHPRNKEIEGEKKIELEKEARADGVLSEEEHNQK